MKIHVRAEGVVWLVLGIGLCIRSIQMDLGHLHNPGAGFFPFLSGASLGILGLVVALSGSFRRSLKLLSSNWIWRRLVAPIIALFILLLYVLLLEPLGFLLTTSVCLFLLFKLSEPKKWLAPSVLTFAAVVLSYLLFSVWLQCQLPIGVFGF